MLLTRRNNSIDDFFSDPSFFNSSYRDKTALMRTDIEDDGNNYIIEIELPGYKKENVHAELKEGYLTVYAEAADSLEGKGSERNFIRRERYIGSCERHFYIGSQLRQEDVKAVFDNGILKLSVPKEAPRQVAENHSITIE